MKVKINNIKSQMFDKLIYIKMKKLVKILFIVATISNYAFSQEFKGYFVRAEIINGDTVPLITLTEVKIISDSYFKSESDYLRYKKLVRDVKKAYPYSLIVAQKLKEYNDIMLKLPDEASRKQAMKTAEKQLRAQFEDDVNNMTFTQGKILIKLIDRETGKTSYELVKELRGTISAIFWQSIARIFGTNLKGEYMPYGEDKGIEEIVQKIERGEI